MRFAALVFVLPFLLAADWPGWRGPHGDGTTSEREFPTKWSASENVTWKVPVPGIGHSSPIVSAEKVFLTTCRQETKERLLLCYDRTTGSLLWEQVVVVAPLERKHKLNSYASSTPAADGQHVYVTFYDQPRLRVYCYDFTGKKLWDVSPGEFHSVHGFCSSPVLYKDLVIINADQDPKPGGPAYIVALDRATGKERWRIDRPNRLRSYCPPVILTAGGREQMVLTGSKCVTSYDPNTGELLWIVNGPTEQFVASVVLHQGLVFLTAGFPERWVMAIDPTGTGNVTKTHVRWSRNREGGYVPAPVAHDGIGYVVSDEGIATGWDLKTGKRLWKERLGGHQTASGVVAGEHVYFIDDDGETFVLKAGPHFEILARNPLGEHVYTSPAFSDGQIFLRSEQHLFCIGTRR